MKIFDSREKHLSLWKGDDNMKINWLTITGVALSIGGVVLNTLKEKDADKKQTLKIEKAVEDYMNDHQIEPKGDL